MNEEFPIQIGIKDGELELIVEGRRIGRLSGLILQQYTGSPLSLQIDQFSSTNMKEDTEWLSVLAQHISKLCFNYTKHKDQTWFATIVSLIPPFVAVFKWMELGIVNMPIVVKEKSYVNRAINSLLLIEIPAFIINQFMEVIFINAELVRRLLYDRLEKNSSMSMVGY